jgi:hypothetical protein
MEKTWRDESPSVTFGHQVGLKLSEHLAFLDDQYALYSLIEHIKIENDRTGPDGPYYDVWKLSESFPHRQYFLWSRIAAPGYLQEHARLAWGPFGNERPTLTKEQIDASIADVVASVRKIQARGGEVVFVRPPSAGPYLERENRRAPRAATWDRLLAATGSVGVHFEDYPETRSLDVPEWSHLSRESAARFTRAYVEALRERNVGLRSGAVLHPGT